MTLEAVADPTVQDVWCTRLGEGGACRTEHLPEEARVKLSEGRGDDEGLE